MDMAGVYRAEYGRCVATLARLLGDIGLAEEAVQDAFAVALEKWATPPPNPGAWIVTTARGKWQMLVFSWCEFLPIAS